MIEALGLVAERWLDSRKRAENRQTGVKVQSGDYSSYMTIIS
jgi:hypothetical protein